MNYIIDRIEGETAVLECEDLSHIDANLGEIDGNPREGDCLTKVGERYIIDHELTKKRRDSIIALQKSLFE